MIVVTRICMYSEINNRIIQSSKIRCQVATMIQSRFKNSEEKIIVNYAKQEVALELELQSLWIVAGSGGQGKEGIKGKEQAMSGQILMNKA